jgi:2-(1,2-epoxy-1,2-dihydrophenyl)acetyl-CoA isomerase
MTKDSAQSVRLEFRNDIAFLTLSRPEVGNSINLDLGREFFAAALAVESAAARAIVLTGEGKNFCFGGDLKGMVTSGSDVRAYLRELTTQLHDGMAHFARMDAPLIAAVNGTAAGAGLGLVLAADITIAARSAKFAPAYTGVGLTPDAGCTFFLPRAIGYKRAMEMFLTNRVLDAEQALAWGLVNQVVDDDTLLSAAEALATRIAAGPLGAFGIVKRLMAESLPSFEAQLARESHAISTQAAAPEGREGIAAFLEKRPPGFPRVIER